MAAHDDPAAAERAAICDLLAQVGPDQPTLCEGWLTRDLAAHLVVRERKPLAAAGIVVKPVAAYTARVQGRYAQRPFGELVDTLRRPPRWNPARLGPVDRAFNTVEMFIHHEDIRRAQPDWRPRPLPESLGRAIWSRLTTLEKLRVRRFRATVVIEAPGYGEIRTGAGGPEVRLRGDPGELVIYLNGRQDAAEVDVSGPEELTARLARARLGT
jgi:uncharacterized protein (TIGR03085 family)